MIGENRQFVTNELGEFKKYPVEVQNCRKIADHFRGIYRIYPNWIKENRRMWTCNWSDMQTLGSPQPVVKLCPKISRVTGTRWPWWNTSFSRSLYKAPCSLRFEGPQAAGGRWSSSLLNSIQTNHIKEDTARTTLLLSVAVLGCPKTPYSIFKAIL